MHFILLSLIVINCFAQEFEVKNTQLVINDERLFDPNFLRDYDTVAQTLVADKKFQHVSFKSTDGIQLAGLARINPLAPYSVICCAGFVPGRKEGIATLIELLPPEVNILFFDARGHGASSGRFWTNLHNYGLHEKEDIFGAIKCINELCNNKLKPIVLHGTCAGAYHATNALIELPNNQEQIAGLILDSGFTSPLDCMDIPGAYCKEKLAPGYSKKIYKKDSKDQIKKRYLTRFLAMISSFFMNSLAFCVRPFLKPKADKLDLLKKMQKNPIQCPVLFIHAENDAFAKIAPVKSLAQLVPNRQEWWITNPKAEHALNLIKCKEEYYAQIQAFLNTIFNKQIV